MSYITRRRRIGKKTTTSSITKVRITPPARVLLESFGIYHIPDTLVGSGASGNILKRDAADWLAENGPRASAGNEEE